MFTYAVYERTTNKTNIVVARSEERAIEIAKMNFNMPLFGFYTTTLIH